MEFIVEGVNTETIIKIKGEIVSENCHQLREKISELINNEPKNIILDFIDTSFIDSAGLGVLIGMKSTITKRKGNMKIININERIKEIFSITRIDKLFNIE